MIAHHDAENLSGCEARSGCDQRLRGTLTPTPLVPFFPNKTGYHKHSNRGSSDRYHHSSARSKLYSRFVAIVTRCDSVQFCFFQLGGRTNLLIFLLAVHQEGAATLRLAVLLLIESGFSRCFQLAYMDELGNVVAGR